MRGDKIDIAALIFDEIEKSYGFEGEILKYFFEISEEIESSKEQRAEIIFSEEDKYRYREEYGKMIDGYLTALIHKNLPEIQFYENLWEVVNNDMILSEKKQKIFALYYIWIDARIPYFQLEAGFKMSNEEYKRCSENMLPLILKTRFALVAPTEQKTERASRILGMLNELKTEKEKIVLMSHIIEIKDKREIISELIQRHQSLEE